MLAILGLSRVIDRVVVVVVHLPSSLGHDDYDDDDDDDDDDGDGGAYARSNDNARVYAHSFRHLSSDTAGPTTITATTTDKRISICSLHLFQSGRDRHTRHECSTNVSEGSTLASLTHPDRNHYCAGL